MSRATAPERLRRVLSIVPYIVANPGQTVGALAGRFDLDEGSLLEDLSVVFMVGLPPYSPDSLVDVEIDDESRVTIRLADFFSRPLRLTPDQALALVASSDALLSVPGADPDGSLSTALAKLASTLGVADSDPVDVHLGSAESELLDGLRSATASGAGVELRYYSYGRDAVAVRKVDPWRVFADQGNWYLHGWCHEAGGERIFRVDRVESLAETGLAISVGPTDDGEWAGVFHPRDDDPTVTLLLAADAAWVADTYPCERVVVSPDGSVEIDLVVTAVPWLERLLVRLGSAVEVKAGGGLPDAPRLASATAERILQRYQTKHS